MSTAMGMKQALFNVDTEGLEFMIVYPQKMLEFSAVLVSLCSGYSLVTNRTAYIEGIIITISTLFLPRES